MLILQNLNILTQDAIKTAIFDNHLDAKVSRLERTLDIVLNKIKRARQHAGNNRQTKKRARISKNTN